MSNPRPEEVSGAELGRRLGVSRSAVFRAKQEGRITALPNGKFNPDLATAQWAANTSPKRSRVSTEQAAVDGEPVPETFVLTIEEIAATVDHALGYWLEDLLELHDVLAPHLASLPGGEPFARIVAAFAVHRVHDAARCKGHDDFLIAEPGALRAPWTPAE